jgi:hypothetical protein
MTMTKLPTKTVCYIKDEVNSSKDEELCSDMLLHEWYNPFHPPKGLLFDM